MNTTTATKAAILAALALTGGAITAVLPRWYAVVAVTAAGGYFGWKYLNVEEVQKLIDAVKRLRDAAKKLIKRS